MNRRRYAYLSTLVLLATSPFPTFALTDTFTGLNSAFWNDSGNWDNGIPNNTLAQTFDVQINTPQTVQLNINATINSLTLTSQAALAFLPATTLTLAAGPITNAGTLLINGTTSASSLFLATDSTLTGAGTLLLTGPLSQVTGTAGTRLTTDNLITGQGSLGLSNLKFTNSGTIIASAGTLTLAPANATDGFINTGILRADGGKLILGSSTYTNTGGTIEAINGSTANITGTVIGGNINGLGGTITFPTNSTLNSVALAGTINASGQLTFIGVSTNSGALQVSTLSLNNATVNNTGTIFPAATTTTTASFTGGGTITLSSATFGDVYSDNVINEPSGIGSSLGFKTFTNTGTILVNKDNLTINQSGTGTLNNFGGIVEAQNAKDATLSGVVNGGTLWGNGGTIVLSKALIQSLSLEGNTAVASQSTSTFGGTITNNGKLTFNGGGVIYSPQSADTVFNGTGNIVLNNAVITNGQTPPGRLVNYCSISGGGALGIQNDTASSFKLVNYGTISATTGFITIYPSSSTDSFYNYGLLQANGQGLIIQGSLVGQGLVLIDSGGTIEALGNSILTLGNSAPGPAELMTFTGTTFIAANSTITIKANSVPSTSSNATFQDTRMTGSITLSIRTINLYGYNTLDGTMASLLTGATLTNLNGTFNNMGNLSGFFQFTLTGDSTLSGGGSITLGANDFFSASDVSLTSDNVLAGLGTIGNGHLRFTNTGTIDSSFAGDGVVITPKNASDGFINQGILEANRGSLTLSASVYTNTGGLIEALNHSRIDINGTVNGGTLLSNGLINVNASSSVGPITGTGTINVAAGITLISDGLSLNTLLLSGTHVLSASSSWSGTSQLSSLVIATDTANNYTGQLDLNNNALILLSADTNSKATTRSTLINQIASGKSNGINGPWTGTGITSSTVASDQSATGQHLTTLALIDNAELGATSFRGQTGLDANSLIITQALLGDVDLSGVIDFADLLKVAQNYGQTGGWAIGNMDGPDNGGTSTTVDFGDLLLVAQHFGQTLPILPDSNLSPQSSPLSATPVPEPTTLMLLTLPMLFKRRRRKRLAKMTIAQCPVPIAD